MKQVTILFLCCVSFGIGLAQEKKAGPVIQEFGKVWPVEKASYPIKRDGVFKVVFDIMSSPKDSTALNRSIETAARFLNMHAQNQVSLEHMKVALVIHGNASKDLLTKEAYRSRFGTDNPNTAMITQLLNAGTEFILCGQSSKSRNIPIAETIDGVQLSLSAMTALIQLQNDGYRLIKF